VPYKQPTYDVGWMKDDFHAYFTGYVREIADRLGRKDWAFLLDRRAPQNDALAETNVTYGVASSMIRFSTQFPSLSLEEQREIVVHEILHAHHDRIDTHIFHAIEANGSTALLTMLRKCVSNDIEMIVDALATAIAPLFPLPEPGT
jgi:hypothetical protein